MCLQQRAVVSGSQCNSWQQFCQLAWCECPCVWPVTGVHLASCGSTAISNAKANLAGVKTLAAEIKGLAQDCTILPDIPAC